MDRATAVSELKLVYKTLSGDLDTALDGVRQYDDQFARRTLYRTYFAFVEGLAFQLRQVTVASLANTDVLSVAELSLLREEKFQLNHKGEPEARDNFQSSLPNLLFCIRCYVKNHGATYQPNIGLAGWDAMKKATAIRDKLMHPKSAVGLEVLVDDVQTLRAASDWWNRTLLEMFTACGEADVRFRKELEGHVQSA